MSEQQPTRSDPTPEERVGDSSIKPVVIAFVVTILIILVAAIIFMKARQNKAIPTPHDSHPSTMSVPLPVPAFGQLRSVLTA
jgi:Na+-transporting methylmalonyl-CoA/oxaloacetate decarboxylase gamma subunit